MVAKKKALAGKTAKGKKSQSKTKEMPSVTSKMNIVTKSKDKLASKAQDTKESKNPTAKEEKLPKAMAKKGKK